MTGKLKQTILRDTKRILYQIKQRIFYRKLDWNSISKPLKEDSSKLFKIHNPTIAEYRLKYNADGKVKTSYDWWYSAILKDLEGKLYFFILAFHPKWSFYRIIQIDLKQNQKNFNFLPKFPVVGCDFHEKIGYSEQVDSISIWASKTGKAESSQKTFAKCTIKTGKSHLTLKTGETTVDLNFLSLGLPFWINRGREAVCSPRGDTMSGFYDICKVEGFLNLSAQKTRINGVGVNEHLMSFTPPERYWERIDGVFFCTEEVYCAFWYLQNTTEPTRFEYKDGAVFIRTTREYLIPMDFKIEYLEYDRFRRFPIKIRILADTKKGKLNAVAQAMAETEKQLAFKIIDGQFDFKDGSKLKLTNGYGQHALH
jgi:hypothetical protein